MQSNPITERIRALAVTTGVPVSAFSEDFAASGGYWFASAAVGIYVSESRWWALSYLRAPPGGGICLHLGIVVLSAEPGPTPPATRYRAVLFDLLTALLDSSALWTEAAGDAESARRWRKRYLDVTYGAGVYQPYEALVAQAAADTGLAADAVDRLIERYGELRPWPGVRETLSRLRDAGITLGVVTNCSERLGWLAAETVGAPFDAVVTAEAAGVYKPEPAVYEAAIAALGAPRAQTLFVAGSAYDLVGTARVGLDTFWHDRAGMTPPEGTPAPLLRSKRIEPLLTLVGVAARPGDR